MKTNKSRKAKAAKTHNDTYKIKWHTIDQVFKKAAGKSEFRRAYQEETERIKIAQSIREIRVSKNMTQAAVAKRISMPQSVIARLESGSHGVSVDTLSKVAHALGKRVEIA